MENFQTYPERCAKLGIKPLPEVLTVLAEENSVLSVRSKGLNESDFFSIISVMHQGLPYLEEVSFTGYEFSLKVIQALGEAVRTSKHIKKFSLTNGHFSVESLKILIGCLKLSKNLEYLDLSQNSLSDLHNDVLKGLLRSNLKILVLDQNEFQTVSYANDLASSQLFHFSINDNPLSYSSVIRLIECLPENKTLSSLSLLGIQFSGAAPIKENSSGLLDAQEGLILKLAYVLRGSFLNHLGIDISPAHELQLKELENTLIKHNRNLISIDSRLVDWKNLPVDSPLINIQLGLKANKWLASGNSGAVPLEIREIVKIKEAQPGHSEESNKEKSSSKGSFLNITEESEENEFNSPHFAGTAKKKHSPVDLKQIFRHFEKITAKVNELDGRVFQKLDGLERKIESIEERERTRENRINNIEKTIENYESRLRNLESKMVFSAESSLKNLETLKFSINRPSKSEEKVASIETSVKKLFNKIKNIEEKANEPIEKTIINKFVNFEDRLSQVEKVSSSITGLNKGVKETVKKVKKIEEVLTSPNRDLDYTSPSQVKKENKGTAEYESILMNSLLERANFSLKNTPERPTSAMSLYSSYSKVPSSDLKSSLRKRGLNIYDI